MISFKQYLAEDTKEGPPTASDRAKDKHSREKEELTKRQDKEKEKAREDDFRKKESERRREIQKRESERRAKQNEALEDGTDELVAAYKKEVPEQ